MAQTAREQKWVLSDEEIEERIKLIRKHLNQLNLMVSELLNEGVYGTWYMGQHSTQTYLPEIVMFKRNRTEVFGQE